MRASERNWIFITPIKLRSKILQNISNCVHSADTIELHNISSCYQLIMTKKGISVLLKKNKSIIIFHNGFIQYLFIPQNSFYQYLFPL